MIPIEIVGIERDRTHQLGEILGSDGRCSALRSRGGLRDGTQREDKHEDPRKELQP